LRAAQNALTLLGSALPRTRLLPRLLRRSTKLRRENLMGNFLRENWLYIVAPLALILVGLTVFIVFFSDSTSSNFIYNIF
jgi:hypothetical protein